MSYDIRLLLRESTPVVAILIFWGIISSILRSQLFFAGLLMALLYTVIRGLALTESSQPPSRSTDVSGVLRENVRVAVPAGLWALLSQLIAPFRFDNLLPLPLSELAETVVSGLALGLSWGSVAVVLLYVIAVGVPRGQTLLAESSVVDD
jgi:hypothetical protein